MVKRHGPPSQGWRTFLCNHAPETAAMDLFVVPTIGFDLLYAFIIVRLDRRELVWINVTTNPTAEWIARQITEAFPWNDNPQYLTVTVIASTAAWYTPIARHGHPVCTENAIRIEPVRESPQISAGSPWQNCFAERLIGSIRRECVDHLVVFGERHLR